MKKITRLATSPKNWKDKMYKHKLDKLPDSFKQLTNKGTWDSLATHIQQLEKRGKPYYIRKHHSGLISIWSEFYG